MRIVFVGDSVTYGGGHIQEEQLFCRIVESSARREGKNVEVVNLSAPAWSPQNWSNYIDKRGLHQADIVVLVLPECDLARPLTTMSWAGHQSHDSPLRLGNIVWKIHKMMTRHRSKGGMTLAQSAAANCAAVKRLRERVGNRRFFAVLIPSAQSAYRRFWPLFEAQLPAVIDLRDDLQDGTLFVDGIHLNAEGHSYVAERIFDRLRSELDQGTAPPLRPSQEGHISD